LLDLMENSIRAGASLISVTVAEDPSADTMTIAIEDDGPGIDVPADVATDPFYTTKAGKRTGLGLSLLRSTIEQAAGSLALSQSPLGGLAVRATMQLSHVDRRPLGDLAATLSSVVCTHPELDFLCRFRVGARESLVRVSDVAKELPMAERGSLAVAQRVSKKISSELAAVNMAP
jgi:hypothetical protein